MSRRPEFFFAKGTYTHRANCVKATQQLTSFTYGVSSVKIVSIMYYLTTSCIREWYVYMNANPPPVCMDNSWAKDLIYMQMYLHRCT